MNEHAPRTFTSIFITTVFIVFNGCGKTAVTDSAPSIAVSIAPLASLVKHIAGSDIPIQIIMPSGSNVHTFDLTPDVVQRVSQCKLFVFIGAGLEYWDTSLLEQIEGTVSVLRVADSVQLLSGHGHEDHHHESNPHVWLDPMLLISVVPTITQSLNALDPSRRDLYNRNAAELIDSLSSLDAWIRDEVHTWKSRSFVSHHASWDYFARRYGLEQIAVLEQNPGRELSARELARLVDFMKTEQTRQIFAEQQSPTKAAETLASEIDGKLVVLDPLGDSRTSYFSFIRENVKRMSEIMR